MQTQPLMRRITVSAAAGFKYYVTEMVCWATGGPQKYTGRSMSESHKHLKINESEWAAFCKDFDDTMAKFNVPEAEHKELFAIVESTKGDIVTPSSWAVRGGGAR